MNGFVHLENEVATRLGVNRPVLRALRGSLLVEGVDFGFEKNRAAFSDAGLVKLEAHFKLKLPAQPLPQSAPEPVTLCVWNHRLKNRRIVEAYLPGTNPQRRENIVRVRVRSAENFRKTGPDGKPMELLARHVQADLYELLGAVPRRPGRW